MAGATTKRIEGKRGGCLHGGGGCNHEGAG